MRLIKRNIEQDGSGSVTLFPEEPEDMWHAYNLIRPRDLLKASAVRRVTNTATTGTTSSSRVHMTLQIRVKSLDFDPQKSQLHVSGQIVTETPYTKIGQHHTLDLELQRNFTLEKTSESSNEGGGWDSVALEMLRDAVDESYKRRAEAIAVVMQEGLANICFIGQFQTVVKQKVEMAIPRKRQGGSDHDKGLSKFFQVTLETLLRLLEPSSNSVTSTTTSNGTSTRPVLLASPGFTATSFQKHIQAASSGKPELKSLLDNTIVVHSSSGHVHSLAEVLQSPSVQARLSNTKYARETAIMDTFYTHLRMDTNKATYGAKEVESAVDQGAVGRGGGILLISNRLFRSQSVHERRRWVSLVDRVRDVEGGEVRVLSSDHESGKRLDGLGGVAAILTFPIIEDDHEEDDNADG
ncbi:Translation factor pelota [Ophidiomyces ophidiicola]|uniref:Translation factor pelota n=1 Tax=Ophidiomyces ophidiicola TaxID=1387563 RepID=UPI0020C39111|nr:Translation factor pelota [Ophidiomyces ophidiicola]KAI1936466.1 Translation factor pelota [Ophidiomyces ophidiicola]KAI1951803.1 Translation factor pelota [Ophidiomyces ophidiicola]KAI1973860.1 Translation factor pelota [Ophidiomyces ophidiicola]KAI1975695.1 Translation factor pelota [Ophidiomyces ophidiicola]KAI1981229.1 Translation factor pelota [Ophidiomyces ophidiicola]